MVRLRSMASRSRPTNARAISRMELTSLDLRTLVVLRVVCSLKLDRAERWLGLGDWAGVPVGDSDDSEDAILQCVWYRTVCDVLVRVSGADLLQYVPRRFVSS